MKTASAIKKLEKAGFAVKQMGNAITAKLPTAERLVEFFDQRGEVVCLGFRHQNDHSDTMSDYCATIFCDSMAQAMRLASK